MAKRKPTPEILDFAQLAIRKHEACVAMLAALKAIKTAADREVIVAGRHKRSEGQALIAAAVAAIAAAEAAGIKAD